VLPDGFVQLFEMAGRGDPDTAWMAGGRIYPFQVCPPPSNPPLELEREAASVAVTGDFTAITVDGAGIAAPVTASPDRGPKGRIEAAVPPGDRLLGTLVHRMLQRGVDAAADPDALVLDAHALALDDELAAVEDAEAAVRDAAATFRALAARPDVTSLLASGERLHEVPFTFTRDGRLLRGTIDCLVMQPGGIVVVEFKTGHKRAEHQQQLDTYVEAARELFPGADVSGVLVYP
jgi:hypothetical protein